MDFTTGDDWRKCKEDYDEALQKLPHLVDNEATTKAFIAGWQMAQRRFQE